MIDNELSRSTTDSVTMQGGGMEKGAQLYKLSVVWTKRRLWNTIGSSLILNVVIFYK